MFGEGEPSSHLYFFFGKSTDGHSFGHYEILAPASKSASRTDCLELPEVVGSKHSVQTRQLLSASLSDPPPHATDSNCEPPLPPPAQPPPNGQDENLEPPVPATPIPEEPAAKQPTPQEVGERNLSPAPADAHSSQAAGKDVHLEQTIPATAIAQSPDFKPGVSATPMAEDAEDKQPQVQPPQAEPAFPQTPRAEEQPADIKQTESQANGRDPAVDASPAPADAHSSQAAGKDAHLEPAVPATAMAEAVEDKQPEAQPSGAAQAFPATPMAEDAEDKQPQVQPPQAEPAFPPTPIAEEQPNDIKQTESQANGRDPAVDASPAPADAHLEPAVPATHTAEEGEAEQPEAQPSGAAQAFPAAPMAEDAEDKQPQVQPPQAEPAFPPTPIAEEQPADIKQTESQANGRDPAVDARPAPADAHPSHAAGKDAHLEPAVPATHTAEEGEAEQPEAQPSGAAQTFPATPMAEDAEEPPQAEPAFPPTPRAEEQPADIIQTESQANGCDPAVDASPAPADAHSSQAAGKDAHLEPAVPATAMAEAVEDKQPEAQPSGAAQAFPATPMAEDAEDKQPQVQPPQAEPAFPPTPIAEEQPNDIKQTESQANGRDPAVDASPAPADAHLEPAVPATHTAEEGEAEQPEAQPSGAAQAFPATPMAEDAEEPPQAEPAFPPTPIAEEQPADIIQTESQANGCDPAVDASPAPADAHSSQAAGKDAHLEPAVPATAMAEAVEDKQPEAQPSGAAQAFPATPMAEDAEDKQPQVQPPQAEPAFPPTPIAEEQPNDIKQTESQANGRDPAVDASPAGKDAHLEPAVPATHTAEEGEAEQPEAQPSTAEQAFPATLIAERPLVNGSDPKLSPAPADAHTSQAAGKNAHLEPAVPAKLSMREPSWPCKRWSDEAFSERLWHGLNAESEPGEASSDDGDGLFAEAQPSYTAAGAKHLEPPDPAKPMAGKLSHMQPEAVKHQRSTLMDMFKKQAELNALARKQDEVKYRQVLRQPKEEPKEEHPSPVQKVKKERPDSDSSGSKAKKAKMNTPDSTKSQEAASLDSGGVAKKVKKESPKSHSLDNEAKYKHKQHMAYQSPVKEIKKEISDWGSVHSSPPPSIKQESPQSIDSSPDVRPKRRLRPLEGGVRRQLSFDAKDTPPKRHRVQENTRVSAPFCAAVHETPGARASAASQATPTSAAMTPSAKPSHTTPTSAPATIKSSTTLSSHHSQEVKCLILSESRFQELQQNGGGFLLRSYGLSKLPMTFHIVVSVEKGNNYAYTGSIEVGQSDVVSKRKDLSELGLSTPDFQFWLRKLQQESNVFAWHIGRVDPITPRLVKFTSQKFRNRHFSCSLELLSSGSVNVQVPEPSLHSTGAYFLKLLPSKAYKMLHQNAHALDGYALRVGTGCSGSDVGIVALKKLLDTINQEFGVTWLNLPCLSLSLSLYIYI